MVSVNGTLIVQMIAFSGAWWFIDTYLLRPIIAIIAQEADAHHEIAQVLEVHKQKLVEKERYKQERWFHFQLLFARSAPQVSYQQVSCTLPSKNLASEHPATDHDAQALQNSTVQLIAERIRNEF